MPKDIKKRRRGSSVQELIGAKQFTKYGLLTNKGELLFYLVKNRNIALSRQQLLESVWGVEFFGDDRTVDAHIKMLRNSLGDSRDMIVTLRGYGYKFEV